MNRASKSTGSGELSNVDLDSNSQSGSLSSQDTLLPQRQSSKGGNSRSGCGFLLGLSIANALMVGASVTAGEGLTKLTHTGQQDYDPWLILYAAAGSTLTLVVGCVFGLLVCGTVCCDYLMGRPKTPAHELTQFTLFALLGAADTLFSVVIGCALFGKAYPLETTIPFASAAGAGITSVAGMSTLFCLPKDNKKEINPGQALGDVTGDQEDDQPGGQVLCVG